MEVELCSENPEMGMSPRISFSYDFCQTDCVPIEPQQQEHPLRSNSSSSALINPSTSDFNFYVRESFDQESSSADELFFGGKLLPTEIKKKTEHQKPEINKQQNGSDTPLTPQHQSRIANDNHNNYSKIGSKKESPEEKQSPNKSFWSFKRSSSCGSGGGGYGRSLCPLPLLSRSNSTGSSGHKTAPRRSSSSSSSSLMSSYQKPPLKKCHNVNQANHTLNLHSGNLFGLGSMFSPSGKDKSKRK